MPLSYCRSYEVQQLILYFRGIVLACSRPRTTKYHIMYRIPESLWDWSCDIDQDIHGISHFPLCRSCLQNVINIMDQHDTMWTVKDWGPWRLYHDNKQEKYQGHQPWDSWEKSITRQRGQWVQSPKANMRLVQEGPGSRAEPVRAGEVEGGSREEMCWSRERSILPLGIFLLLSSHIHCTICP